MILRALLLLVKTLLALLLSDRGARMEGIDGVRRPLRERGVS